MERFRASACDGMICDLRLPFRGNRDGGLLSTQQFATAHPASGIVLVSAFFSADEVNALTPLLNCAFVEKGPAAVTDVVRVLARVVTSKAAFICMPYSAKFEDIYEQGIKPVVLDCGFKCERANEIEHNRGCLDVVFRQIRAANLVIADMTGRNANVYYEVSCAHGVGREVILLAQEAEELPFDLRDVNHIVYEGRITPLKDKLGRRIKSLRSS